MKKIFRAQGRTHAFAHGGGVASVLLPLRVLGCRYATLKTPAATLTLRYHQKRRFAATLCRYAFEGQTHTLRFVTKPVKYQLVFCHIPV